jgi:hypothetical protein
MSPAFEVLAGPGSSFLEAKKKLGGFLLLFFVPASLA